MPENVGAQFDALAGQVTALFNQIQAQSVITQADYQRANLALGQLAEIVNQLNNSYVNEQWNGPHYKTVYEQRLQQIAAAAQAATIQPGNVNVDPVANVDPVTGAPIYSSGAVTADSTNTLILLAAAGALLYLLIKR